MNYEFLKSKITIISVVSALLILVIVIVLSSQSSTKKVVSKKNSINKVITNSTDNPDENVIDVNTFNWQGKPTDPKYISIPSINAGGFVQKVGVDQRSEVGVPTNINFAGWFTPSSLPGSKGLSIIDGHVDGKTQPGIFKNLAKLKTGQKFTIEFGNGNKKTFSVTSIQQVSQEQAPSVLYSQDPAVASQLNLITCGGTFDSAAHHYLDRVIVSAVPK